MAIIGMDQDHIKTKLFWLVIAAVSLAAVLWISLAGRPNRIPASTLNTSSEILVTPTDAASSDINNQSDETDR